jgi:peptide deformylase
MTTLAANRMLGTKSRDRLKDSDFAIPEDRAYPIHDLAHARNALARVVQNGTALEQARVRKAVARKYPELGKPKETTPANNTSFQSITVNLDLRKSHIRTDYLEGREYYVCPVVMLTEGVHNGSNGPLYYPSDELAKTPVVWDHKPIVVYHPQTNGQSVSACSREIIESRKVGLLLNTRYAGKLKAEAWLEKARLGEVDKRVLTAIEAGKPMEVSTGLFTDNEGPGGTWNGEKYIATARNYRPDHLAILPDQKGSCSMADGAGLLMNAVKGSHNDLRDRLGKELRTKGTNGCNDAAGIGPLDGGCIDDVFDTHFVYSKAGKTYSQAYKVDKEGCVKFDGLPTEVTRETRYKTADGKIVGNHSTGKERTMDKELIVDGIIANAASGWTEEDRDFLMELEDTKLEKVALNAAATEEVEADETTDKKGNKKPGKGKLKDAVDATDPVNKKGKTQIEPDDEEDEALIENMTAEEYIARAPEGIRDMLGTGLAAFNAEKGRVIATITANKANPFTPAFLATKPLDELRGIAKLSANTARPTPRFIGQGDAGGITDNAAQTEVLDIPSMDFSK